MNYIKRNFFSVAPSNAASYLTDWHVPLAVQYVFNAVDIVMNRPPIMQYVNWILYNTSKFIHI